MKAKFVTAQDYFKSCSVDVAMGFNRRVYGESFTEAVRQGEAGIATGWQIADDAIREGKIYYLHNMHSDGRCCAFPYGGTWVCNGCGNSLLNKPWWIIRVFKDGNAWCCVGEGFENLQESDNYAFGKDREEAINNYRALMLQASWNLV